MNKLFAIGFTLLALFCGPCPCEAAKIPCYAWLSWPGTATDKDLEARFTDLKRKGIDGVLYSAGHDPETYRRIGKIVKAAGVEKCVSDFKAQTGLDIRTVKDPSKVEAWKRFRYDLITKLVNRLAKDVRSKGKRITAAVFPGPNSVARKIVRQEWDKWDLDAFFPMNYNDFYLEGTKWIGAMCKEAVTALHNRRPVFSGLFICPDPAKKAVEPDPENHGLVPGELEAAIKESMENGAAGICLFTPDRMTEAHWAVFEKAIQLIAAQ